jgi:two-component system response regulator AlgR
LRILVVDDEPLARERVISLLEELAVGEVVGAAANGLEALAKVAELGPDVVLLDIRMPGMDGLEAARHLAKREDPPAVLFTTAYDDHALEAFDASAVDYLLKPIRRDRLQRGLQRAQVVEDARLLQLNRTGGTLAPRTQLSASRLGRLELVPIVDVRFLVAEHKYVTAGWPGGELVLDESLANLEREFADTFLRIHRNALIAPAHVSELKSSAGGHVLVMTDVERELKVSRRHISAVRARLAKGTEKR